MIVPLTMALLAGFVVLAPVAMALLVLRGTARPEDAAAGGAVAVETESAPVTSAPV